MFTEFGYERANMREIAKRAGVATGTLFLYAPDKRNLLLWILNDDLDAITDSSFGEVAFACPDGTLVEQLLVVFEARYRYWGKDPGLSLHALQELILARDVEPSPASHIEYYRERRAVLLDRIADIVRAQQQRGLVEATTSADVIARLALSIFNAAVRAWLRDVQPDVAAGVAELRALLALALEGGVKTSARGVDGT